MSDMNFGTNLIPTSDESYDLGSSTKKWDNLYVANLNGSDISDLCSKANSSDIAIIIDGNKTTHTGGAAIGDFVIVCNSTITGITDGLYTAAQEIPANTAITSAYLTAVDGGGLNALNGNITRKGTFSVCGICSTKNSWGTYFIIIPFANADKLNTVRVNSATYYSGNNSGTTFTPTFNSKSLGSIVLTTADSNIAGAFCDINITVA